MMLRRLVLAALLALAPGYALAQQAWIAPYAPLTASDSRIANTKWVNDFLAGGIPLANGKIFIGSASNIATAQSMSGDCTLVASGVITCTQAAGNFQVIGNLTVGGSIIDGNGILFTNIVAPATPAAGTTRGYVDSTTKRFSDKNDAGTVGNTVVASLAVANQFMTGISAAGVITRAQPAVTDISGFGAGVATWLGTPSSANLRAAITDETGTGSAYFQGGDIGTPSAGVGTNITGLNATNISTGNLAVARLNSGTGAGATTFWNGSSVWATAVTSVTCFGSAITTTGTCATAATKSDQQTGSSTTAVVTPSQQQSHDSGAKAWAVWTGTTGALLAGYNATVVRNSAGLYTITFPTAFASTSFSCLASANSSAVIISQMAGALTTTTAVVFTANTAGVATDPTISGQVVCYGRQ